MRRMLRSGLIGVVLAGTAVALVTSTGAAGRRAQREPCERRVAAILGTNPCPLPEASSITLVTAATSNGTMLRGTDGTSVVRDGPGFYSVRFPSSVAACVWTSGLAQVGNDQPPQNGVIRLLNGPQATVITVAVVDKDGTEIDSPFHLTVTC